jgi:hypothetical protein
MTDDRMNDDAFAERVAKPLRAPERADATFEARAMSAVHAVAALQTNARAKAQRSWWLRPRTFQLAPITSLAMAAGVAALLIGAWTLPSRAVAGPAVAAVSRAPDTVHVVRFVLAHPDARRVSLVGAFNGWEKNRTLLVPSGVDGVWIAEVPLSPGRHEYAFVVEDAQGERWVADPTSPTVNDEFGTESSTIRVGASTS